MKEGITKYYYGNGQLSDFMTYKNNLLDGKYFTYDNGGKVTREVEYKQGSYLNKGTCLYQTLNQPGLL